MIKVGYKCDSVYIEFLGFLKILLQIRYILSIYEDGYFETRICDGKTGLARIYGIYAGIACCKRTGIGSDRLPLTRR